MANFLKEQLLECGEVEISVPDVLSDATKDKFSNEAGTAVPRTQKTYYKRKFIWLGGDPLALYYRDSLKRKSRTNRSDESELAFVLQNIQSVKLTRPGGREFKVLVSNEQVHDPGIYSSLCWRFRIPGERSLASRNAATWVSTLLCQSRSFPKQLRNGGNKKKFETRQTTKAHALRKRNLNSENNGNKKSIHPSRRRFRWDAFCLHSGSFRAKNRALWLRDEFASVGLTCICPELTIDSATPISLLRHSKFLLIPYSEGDSFSEDIGICLDTCIRQSLILGRKIFIVVFDERPISKESVDISDIVVTDEKVLSSLRISASENVSVMHLPCPGYGDIGLSVLKFNMILKEAQDNDLREYSMNIRPIVKRCRPPSLAGAKIDESIRSKEFSKLENMLLGNVSRATFITGGVSTGKTVLAARAANSDKIRRCFSGGVFWIYCSWVSKEEKLFGPLDRVNFDICLDWNEERIRMSQVKEKTLKTLLKNVQNSLVILDGLSVSAVLKNLSKLHESSKILVTLQETYFEEIIKDRKIADYAVLKLDPQLHSEDEAVRFLDLYNVPSNLSTDIARHFNLDFFSMQVLGATFSAEKEAEWNEFLFSSNDPLRRTLVESTSNQVFRENQNEKKHRVKSEITISSTRRNDELNFSFDMKVPFERNYHDEDTHRQAEALQIAMSSMNVDARNLLMHLCSLFNENDLFSQTDIEILSGSLSLSTHALPLLVKSGLISRAEYVWLPSLITRNHEEVRIDAYRLKAPLIKIIEDRINWEYEKNSCQATLRNNLMKLIRNSRDLILEDERLVALRVSFSKIMIELDLTNYLVCNVLLSWKMLSMLVSWNFNWQKRWSFERLIDICYQVERDIDSEMEVIRVTRWLRKSLVHRVPGLVSPGKDFDNRTLAEYLWNRLYQLDPIQSSMTIEDKNVDINDRKLRDIRLKSAFGNFIHGLNLVRSSFHISEHISGKAIIYARSPCIETADVLPFWVSGRLDRSVSKGQSMDVKQILGLAGTSFAMSKWNSNKIKVYDFQRRQRHKHKVGISRVETILTESKRDVNAGNEGEIISIALDGGKKENIATLFPNVVKICSIESPGAPILILPITPYKSFEHHTVCLEKHWLVATSLSVENDSKHSDINTDNDAEVILVWNIDDNEVPHVIDCKRFEYEVSCTCIFAEDCDILASGFSNGDIRLFDLANLNRSKKADAVNTLTNAHNGKEVVTITAIRDWRSDTRDGTNPPIIFCSGGRDKVALVWKLSSRKDKLKTYSVELLFRLPHWAHVTCLNIYLNKNKYDTRPLLVATCSNWRLVIWDLANGEMLHSRKILKDSLNHENLNRRLKIVMARNKRISLHEYRSPATELIYGEEGSNIFFAVVNMKKDRSPKLAIIDLPETGRPQLPARHVPKKHTKSVSHVITSLSEEGKPIFITASLDNTIKIWTEDEVTKAYTVSQTLRGHTKQITGLAIADNRFHIKEPCIVSSGRDALRFWDLYSGRHLHSILAHDANFNEDDEEFQPDIENVADCPPDNKKGFSSVAVISAHHGSYLDIFHESGINFVKCEALVIAVSSEDIAMRVFEYPSYKLLHEISLKNYAAFVAKRRALIRPTLVHKDGSSHTHVWVAVKEYLLLWDLKSPDALTKIDWRTFNITRSKILGLECCSLAKKTILVVALKKRKRGISLIDATSGTFLKDLPHQIEKFCIFDGFVVGSIRKSQQIKVWDIETTKVKACLKDFWSIDHPAYDGKINSISVNKATGEKKDSDYVISIGMEKSGVAFFDMCITAQANKDRLTIPQLDDPDDASSFNRSQPNQNWDNRSLETFGGLSLHPLNSVYTSADDSWSQESE